ncbi:MAG: Cobalt-zinc-cadmium resistance protein CzcA [Candidatus Eremiobacteraeota bacterium]|nr:Cobalt-zinc-cadmium resistance protein CzcA [Candidatus Eremiobacteraeota bacterium]
MHIVRNASLAAFALRHAKVIVFAAVVLAVLGVRSYLVAPESIFPAMSFSRVDVVADAGDLPPDRVRIAITRPLELALQTLPSVQRVRATSTQGSAEIVIDFDPKTDPRAGLQAADQAIAALRGTLTAARTIDAVVVSPNAEPVVSYGLTSSVLSQSALKQFVDTRVIPAFAGTPGLARITSVGGAPVEYHVDLDPSALAAVGVGASDVAAAIGDAANVQSVGTVTRRHQRYVLLVDASPHDASTLAAVNVPLKAGGTVPVGSLGTVKLTTGLEIDQASVNGVHSVNVNAFPLPRADAVTLAREVDARFASLRGRLPADVHLVKYWDQTRLIVASQASLRDAILLGALLAVLVIYLFLRSLRMTLVAAAVIPLAMAIALFAMERSGQTLNLMSVGGLAVAVGLIIDDAIVVIEAIARKLTDEPALTRDEAIAQAGGGIAKAMIASTATTVVVFLPLGLLTGVTGFFFRALAFTLAASLVISLALALFVTPILARWFLGPKAHVAAADDRLERRYVGILRWALAHRPVVYGGAAVVLAVTVLLLASSPSDFLPKLDEGQFEIKYTLPPGASLATTDDAAQRMERIVAADPAVEAEGRLTGVDTNGFSPTQTNTGTIRVALRTGGRAGYDAITERLRANIAGAVPAATLDFHQLLEDQINDLSGAPQPVEITIAGPDQKTLIALAGRATAAIAKVHGVVDAYDGVVYDDPALRIVPQTARLAALGIGRTELADALTAGTGGTVTAQVAGAYAEIPVRVNVAGAPDGTRPGDTALVTKGGTAALGVLARVENAGHTTDINEENGAQLLRVSANIEGASLSAVIAGIRPVVARLGLPPGYTATIGGAYETQKASFGEFANVIAIAVMLVFAVMLATFGSFRLPLVILAAIPLALIGVAVALGVTRTPVNVSSFMGLLLLVGIVVKNGILLIDVANKRRAAGDDVVTSLIAAGSTRLRPILMTTLAAIGGLLPLALGIGSGAEMEKPLAIAVIGGLSTATIFTLVLIPVLYAAFTGGEERRRSVAVPAVATMLALALLGGTMLPARAQGATSVAPGAAVVAPGAAAISFGGLSLADAQTRAVNASPDVRTAHAAVANAQAALAQARGTYGLSATTSYNEAPQGAPEGTIAQRITTTGVQVTLGDMLAYSPLVSQAASALRVAQTDEIAALRTERVKLVGLYYAALKARAVAGARVDAVASANAFADAARKRFAAGDAPRIDVVRAEVALARAQGDLSRAKADDANATDALERETGASAGSLGTTATAPVASAQPLSPEIAIARATANRADLRSANDNVRAAEAAVRAAQRSAIPPVTISAGYSRGVDSGVKIGGPTIGASVAIPLGGALGAKVRAQRALVDVAVAKRDAVTRQIATEAGAAARNAAAAVDAQRASDAALAAARAEIDAVSLGYRSGASTSLDLSTARATYAQAQVDELNAHYDRLQTQAALELEVSQ